MILLMLPFNFSRATDYVRTYGHTPAPEILPRDENAYCQGADSDDGSADERVDGDGDESGSEKQGRKDHVEYVFYEEKEATETGDLVDMELRTGSTTVVREAQAAKEAEQLHSESDAFPSRGSSLFSAWFRVPNFLRSQSRMTERIRKLHTQRHSALPLNCRMRSFCIPGHLKSRKLIRSEHTMASPSSRQRGLLRRHLKVQPLHNPCFLLRT
ncbi:hypothetical protein DFJ74DRAFT_407675 [Hyaloraphidium curvatum]|nr:hypothetical protein DFJ74DRAFT_407675 [Hyaloraphidium curvatum]